jgi:hypothetical protein
VSPHDLNPPAERIHCGLPRVNARKRGGLFLLKIEDSPQLACTGGLQSFTGYKAREMPMKINKETRLYYKLICRL